MVMQINPYPDRDTGSFMRITFRYSDSGQLYPMDIVMPCSIALSEIRSSDLHEGDSQEAEPVKASF